MGALVILLAGQAMAAMDGSILAVAAPSLRSELHTSGAELQLVAATYTVIFAALVVTGARLGDVIGRRRAFLIGLTAFIASSLVGGLAPSPEILIAARASQGAAAALMTPQVLTIIQASFEGDARARAIGAYSLVLAVGVAAGQILGGLLLGIHIAAGSWRLALLINVPVGVVVLLRAAKQGLPATPRGRHQRLDLGGAMMLTVALLGLVVPLTLGREAGWPAWVWLSFAVCAVAIASFVARERLVKARAEQPLFDLRVLALPGVGTGVIAVMLVMAAYAGFLYSLTLHLQTSLGFTPLHAGLTFTAYATGFATASLTWPKAPSRVRDRLPVAGPIAMGCALLATGLIAAAGNWPPLSTAILLFVGGVGHACGFSPLADRLTRSAGPSHAAEVSALVLSATLIGTTLGVAALTGVYLGQTSVSSPDALEHTTGILALVLLVAALAAAATLAATRGGTQAAAAKATG